MFQGVMECQVNFLSYERALTLVPAEFAIGYDWYQSHEGETFPRLPHRDSELSKPSEIKVSADRGIHSPDYKKLASKGAGKERYALSVHSTCKKTPGLSKYEDKDVIHRSDGTWILDYCAHRPEAGKKLTEHGNDYLMNNLRDGVPVAVLVQQSNGTYRNYGLAYIERYDPASGIFTLHGPVSAEKDNVDFCSVIPVEDLSPEELAVLRDADAGDQRKRVIAEQIRREHQGAFRNMLMNAYECTCAATGVNVPQVLQAAHIDPYRGRQSQVVTNGMLLRSDIHLLYDSHLLTVQPESNIIVVSKRLQGTHYGQFHGERIRTPEDPLLKPNDNLLDLHMREFISMERETA